MNRGPGATGVSTNARIYLRLAVSVYLLGLAILVFVPRRQLGYQNLYPSYPWTDVVGNLLLLMPLAIFLRFLLPSWSRFRVFSLVVCTSTIIELIQLVVPGRSGNLKDVLLNSAGGLIVIILWSGRERLSRNADLLVANSSGEIEPLLRIHIHDFSGHPFQIQLSRALAARGASVTHSYSADYLSGQGNFEYQDNHPNSLKIVALSIPGGFPKYQIFGRLKYELRFGKKLRELLRAEKPEIVVLCNLPLLSLLRILGDFWRYKVVYWHQDLYFLGLRKELEKRFGKAGVHLSKVFERIEKAGVKRSQLVVPIGNPFLDQYRRWGIATAKIVEISNWAPLTEIFPTSRDNTWSESKQIPKDVLRILYSGTLGRKHNPSLLLELLDELTLRGIKPILIVVSSGEGADFIRMAAGGRSDVLVFDFQPIEDLSDVISMADISVVLLEPEAGAYSIPSKVLSYLAGGACAAGLLPGSNPAAQSIRECGGFVGNPSSTGVKQLADWIVTLGEDSILAIKSASRDYAETHFDIENKVREFERAFNAL